MQLGRMISWRSPAREEHVGLIDESFPWNTPVVRKTVPTWERDDQALREQAVTHERVARDRRSKNPAWMDPSSRADTCSGAVRSRNSTSTSGCRRAKSRIILEPLRKSAHRAQPTTSWPTSPRFARWTDRAACSACAMTARASARNTRPAVVSSTRRVDRWKSGVCSLVSRR